MQIQQISVFVENKPGRLADITETLAQEQVNIRAVSVADTSDFGILRLIVDKPQEAVRTLREAGHTVSLTNVIAVCMEDTPGSWLIMGLQWNICMPLIAGQVEELL